MNTLSRSQRGRANLVGLKCLKGLSVPACPWGGPWRELSFGAEPGGQCADHEEQGRDHLPVTVTLLKGSPGPLSFQALPQGLGSPQAPGCAGVASRPAHGATPPPRTQGVLAEVGK